MKKIKFTDRVKYWFDNVMSKGTISLILLLFLITAIVVVISGAISAAIAINNGEEASFLGSMWISLMHAIDAGTLAGDTGSFMFILLMSIVTICGLFITSMLIGVISAGLEDKMMSLRKGHSLVLEKNHVIILGFNENTLNILRELVIANENQKNSVVVIMDDQDKTEMEDLIHQRIPETKTTRIICRSGRMDNLNDISVCSPETCRSIIVNATDDFMNIKAILACSTLLDRSDNKNAYITALVFDKDNIQSAKIAGNGRIEVFYFKDSIARIMAQTCRQPGLSSVFTDLLSYAGDEIYVEKIPGLEGRTMAEINMYFSKSTVIGLVKNGLPMINPAMDTVVEQEDKLILIAEDDGVSIPAAKPAQVNTSVFSQEKSVEEETQTTLILGYNEMLPQIILELDSYSVPGSKIIVSFAKPQDEEISLPSANELKNLTLEFYEKDIFALDELSQLLISKPKNILILSDSQIDDNEADSKTLLLLLQLREIARTTGIKFSVTSEMRSVENQELAQITNVTDFVISSNITALITAQVSQTREQLVILDTLLSEDGSELYIKPVLGYVPYNVPVDFYTVTASAVRYGEIAIGYKKVKADGDFDIVLNPEKNRPITFNKDDSLILVAED